MAIRSRNRQTLVCLPLGLLATAIGLATPAFGDTPAPTKSPPHQRIPGEGTIASGDVHHLIEGNLSRLEQRLFEDARDGRLDDHTLLTAALIASGVTEAERLERYESRVRGWVHRLQESGCANWPTRRKAEEILRFLHREILLGGYRLEGTDVAATIDDGRFNCVTATVLFNCLAERCGLAARGLQMPGHAMSRVRLLDGNLDVETTCPEWFRVTNDRPRSAEAVRQSAGQAIAALAPRGPSGSAREVTDVELVATVYYNRGVEWLQQRRFADAVGANAKALRLDAANAAARANLLATVNNWAIELGADGRFADAAILLRQGLALDPAHAPLRANYAHLHREWLKALSAAGQRAEAEQMARQTAADPLLAPHNR